MTLSERIAQRAGRMSCPYCKSTAYTGTLQAHYAAWHPSKAQPMSPFTRRALRGELPAKEVR